MFSLLYQLGFYSFSSITLSKNPGFQRYKYQAGMVNNEMNECYLKLIDMAENISIPR